MKVISSGVVAGFAAAALVSLAPAAHADGGTTVQVRQGDFISQLSDTRANGHYDFLKDGLHVWTDGSTDDSTGTHYPGYTDKTAEYWPASGNLPSNVSMDWYGKVVQDGRVVTPGTQIVFDADQTSSNGNDYNTLVGEPVYGDDFWMTPGSDFYKDHHNLCPETSGGFGSDCHGTLAEWQAAIPNAKVYATGFSLGSGLHGDGIISSFTYNNTEYHFTSEPEITTVPVTGTATIDRHDYRTSTVLKINFATDALGANQAQGKKLTFTIKENGTTIYRTKMGADETSYTRLHFGDGTGKHVVQVYENGVQDQRVVVRMGR
jgi:hypothetical protein